MDQHEQQQAQATARSLQWTDVEGWFSVADANALGPLLDRVPDGGLVVEVGVAFGRTTVMIGNRTEGRGVRVASVDHFRGNSSEGDAAFQIYRDRGQRNVIGQVVDNVVHANMRDRHVLMIADSVQAASMFGNETIDLAFIDADHTDEAVEADILAWTPKVKWNGTLCGHDWSEQPGNTARRMFGDAMRHDANVWYVTDPVEALNDEKIRRQHAFRRADGSLILHD